MLAPGDRIVRVLPDVAGIAKEFDYFVPASMQGSALVDVGTEVRVSLHGRRVGGWVTGVGVEPPANVTLLPVGKVRGIGPPGEVIDLARWAAWRWAGRLTAILAQASPPYVVRNLPHVRSWQVASTDDPVVAAAFAPGCGVRLVSWAPALDPYPIVFAAAHRGGVHGALVVTPSVVMAERLARRLRRDGVPTALLPNDWALAAAGGVVVIGARNAIWAPIESPGAIVVLDEHDEALQEERSPCWHARDVAIERADRLGVPCVLVSSQPTLEARAAAGEGRLLGLDRRSQRTGWAPLEVVDRRAEEPGRHGLLAPRTVEQMRNARRVLCILNRTGRAKLLSCAACDDLVRCESCGGACAVVDKAGPLVCQSCRAMRPLMCQSCGSARLRNVRPGVSRLAEDLATLLNRPVTEVTAATEELGDGEVFVGTEALLHRAGQADLVVFVDLDGELFAPRSRSAEQTLALLGRASRLVRGRGEAEGGRVVVQTRVPEHPVVAAARLGDSERIVEMETQRRQLGRGAPFGAVAMVSGPGSDELAAAVKDVGVGVQVQGEVGGPYRLRADDHATLCDALAGVGRPALRVRVVVDPLR